MTIKDEYISGKVTLHQYYSAIASECGICYTSHPELAKVKSLIESGDVYLAKLDGKLFIELILLNEKELTVALEKRGDFFTIAAGICVHRSALYDAAMNVEKPKKKVHVENIEVAEKIEFF